MQRRDFCKLFAAAAAASSFPSSAQADGAAQSGAGNGFDSFTEDYAKFCAIPASERKFYFFDGKNLVKEKLDEQTWQPSNAHYPKDLPLPAGF